MRNAILGVIGVVVLAAGSQSCEGPISGGACTPIGSTKTVDGQLWTCAKNETTGNGYWYKGKP